MKKLALVLFLSAVFSPIFSQNASRFEIGASVGIVGYLGDLNKSDFIPNQIRPALQGYVRYYVNNYVALKLSTATSRIAGSDADYSSRISRNLTFKTPIIEASLATEIDLFDLNPEYYRFKRGNACVYERVATPYLFIGIGGVYSNPTIDFDATHTTYVNIAEGIQRDRVATYSKYHLVVPIGAGYKLDITPCWGVAVEVSYRVTNTDYLDAVSYAGNPNRTDSYQMFTVSFMHRLGRYSCFPFKPFRR